MVQVGFEEPLNDVVQGVSLGPERLKVGANATPAKMLPGIHVVFDTNDYSVKEGGAGGAVIGILGYAEAAADFKPATRDTAYALANEVPIHNGVFRARVYVTETIVKGEPLVAAADGKFDKGDAITIVASGGANITDGQAVTGSFGAQGPVLGHAAASRTGAGVVWAVMNL